LYLGGMGDFYAAAAQAMGFSEMVDEVRENVRNGDRKGAQAAITSEYIDSIGLFGTPAQIARRLDCYERAGVDEVVLELRKKDLTDQIADLRALATVLT
jgi:hypothetical protein